MAPRIKRKHYFIHFSIQFKYMVMSILPALVMSIFCIYFLLKSGQIMLFKEKEMLSLQAASINKTLQEMGKEEYSKDTKQEIEVLKKKLLIFKENLDIKYFVTVEEWAKIKMALLAILALVLIGVGVMSLLYSHRIAGPLFRIKKSIDMLSECKNIPAVQVRKYDEFKELAGSLEKLRRVLKDRGFLESK